MRGIFTNGIVAVIVMTAPVTEASKCRLPARAAFTRPTSKPPP